MHAKLARLEVISGTERDKTFQWMHDQWDKELGEFMRSAEKICTMFKSCMIEYSPTVGQWL